MQRRETCLETRGRIARNAQNWHIALAQRRWRTRNSLLVSHVKAIIGGRHFGKFQSQVLRSDDDQVVIAKTRDHQTSADCHRLSTPPVPRILDRQLVLSELAAGQFIVFQLTTPYLQVRRLLQATRIMLTPTDSPNVAMNSQSSQTTHRSSCR